MKTYKKIDYTNLLTYFILSLGVIIVIFPYVSMVSTALKLPPETMAYPPYIIPKNPTVDNFVMVFKKVPFARFFINSFIVSATCLLVSLFFCSLAGFAFAKYRFPGRNILFLAILAKLMIPIHVQLIPLFKIVVALKVADTLFAVMLPSFISAFGIFLMRQTIAQIPNELLDAARVDGLGEFAVFLRIILPLSRTPLITLAIIFFVWKWGEFLWPLIVLSSLDKMTLPLGLVIFQNRYYIEYGPTMAAALMTILPVLMLFFVLQRKVTESLALSGLKG